MSEGEKRTKITQIQVLWKETKGTTERLENRGPHVWTLLTPVGACWLGRVSGTRVAVSDPSQDGSSRVSRQQDRWSHRRKLSTTDLVAAYAKFMKLC